VPTAKAFWAAIGGLAGYNGRPIGSRAVEKHKKITAGGLQNCKRDFIIGAAK
jgi:hypothetical protein